MKFVDSKSALTSPVVYATDRSEARVLVVWLCGFYYGHGLALCSRVGGYMLKGPLNQTKKTLN